MRFMTASALCPLPTTCAGFNGRPLPEFLSTHPAAETRIADIKKFIPEAMQYYKIFSK